MTSPEDPNNSFESAKEFAKSQVEKELSGLEQAEHEAAEKIRSAIGDVAKQATPGELFITSAGVLGGPDVQFLFNPENNSFYGRPVVTTGEFRSLPTPASDYMWISCAQSIIDLLTTGDSGEGQQDNKPRFRLIK